MRLLFFIFLFFVFSFYCSSQSENWVIISKNNKYGIFDVSKAKEIQPCIYDEIDNYSYNPAIIIRKNEKYGSLSDKTGKEIIPCIYDNLNYSKIGVVAQKNDTYVLIDSKSGKKTTGYMYDYINYPYDFIESASVKKYYLLAVRNSMYGLLDSTGKEFVPCAYGNICYLKDNLWEFTQEDGTCLVVDMDGKQKFETCEAYHRIHDSSPQKEKIVSKNGRMGVLNTISGKYIIPLEYYYIEDFQNNFYIVCNTLPGSHIYHYGLFNKEGKITAPPVYDECRTVWKSSYVLPNILVRLRKGDKTGIINALTGEVISPFVYNTIFDSNSDLAPVTKDNKTFGLIDKKTGKEIVPCVYDKIEDVSDYPFTDNLFYCCKNNKYGYIGTGGKILLPSIYDEIQPLIGGVAGAVSVKIGNKWGVYKLSGEEIVPPDYEKIGFSPRYEKPDEYIDDQTDDQTDGRKIVGKIIILNKNGKTRFLDYNTRKDLESFTFNGVAYLAYDMPMVIPNQNFGTYGVIDGKTRKEILPFIYNSISLTDDHLAYVSFYDANKEWNDENIIDLKTKEKIIPFHCDGVIHLKDSPYFIFVENEKFGVYDRITKKIVLPCKYKNLEFCSNENVIAQLKGKYGIIELKSQRIIVPFIYDSIYSFQDMVL